MRRTKPSEPNATRESAIVFESDNFIVVAYGSAQDSDFEVMFKPGKRSTFLYGNAAEALRAQVRAWKIVVPGEAEVEDYLDGIMFLGQQPLNIH